MAAQNQILFQVNTVENPSIDIEEYRHYKRLTRKEVEEIIDFLLKEMMKGRVVCLNVALTDY